MKNQSTLAALLNANEENTDHNYRNCPTRFADYVTKLEGLLHRFTHSLTMVRTYAADGEKERAKVERTNLTSIQNELKILTDFRPDWNDRYGITEEQITMLTEY